MRDGILNDEGPKSSYEEDLAALGLGYLVEGVAPKAKKEERIEVPVRQEQDDDEDEDEEKENGENGENGEDEEDEEDEDEDEKEESIELEWSFPEIFDIACDMAEAADLEPEILVHAMCEEFDVDLIPVMEEINWGAPLTEGEDEDEDEDEEDAKTEAAHDVLRAFYGQLAALQEGSGEAPEYDDLVGVIEAFEYINEDLLTEIRFGKKGGKAFKGRKKKMRKGAWKRMKRGVARAHKMGKHVFKGEKMTTGTLKRKLQGMIAGAKSALYRRALKQKKAGLGATKPVASGAEEKGEAISELVQNLSTLSEAVSATKQANAMVGELREGYEAIMNTAGTWMERIAEEVRAQVTEDADYDVDNDPKVTVGRHLESIARDAAKYVEMIDAHGVEEEHLETFGEDLATLATDLEEAAEAMKHIA